MERDLHPMSRRGARLDEPLVASEGMPVLRGEVGISRAKWRPEPDAVLV